MQRAGHELLVASSLSMLPAIENFGFKAVSAGPDWRQDGLFRNRDSEAFRRGTGSGPFLVWAASKTVGDLLEVGRAWRAHILLRDSTYYAGWIVSELLGIPQACWSITLRSPGPQIYASAGAVFDEMFKSYGLPPDPGLLRLEGNAYFDVFPNGFQPGWWPQSPVRRPVRYEAFDGDDEDIPLRLQKDRRPWPLVHATLGTALYHVGPLYERLIAALGRLPVRAVVTVGAHRESWHATRVPDNVELRQFIRHSTLIPQCDVIVSHAGPGVVLKALSAGVPQVLLPLAADQPANAFCCDLCGVGVSLASRRVADSLFPRTVPEAVSASDIQHAVERALDDGSLRSRSRDFQKEIAAMPSTADAAAELERLAGSEQCVR
jgi:hypothetical protein